MTGAGMAPGFAPGLCRCGCGERTKIAKWNKASRGYVAGQPIPYVCGHQRRTSPVEHRAEDRGFRSPCWVWLKGQDGKGYGRAWDGERWRNAYVVLWEREYGPVPPGRELDHLCRVTLCVNPAHLEPVTHAENIRRGATATLDWEQVREIRTLSGTHAEIAKRYGVTRPTISAIRRGLSWREG